MATPLADLDMLCNILDILFATSLADLGMLLQGLRSPTSKRNSPHLLPYKLWSQGNSVSPSLQIWNLVVHYSLNFTVYKAVSWGGGVSLRCGTPRTLQKHADVGRGRCQACLGRCKACLHILSTHKTYFKWI